MKKTNLTRKNKHVTIIIPVYGDWGSLKECIKSLKKNISKKSQNKIILINDNGPEADEIEANILKLIKRRSDFFYYRNEKNAGFVKTCNRAVLEIDKSDNDVLILNSDTKATKGFLNEMASVLYSSPKIAAVCPRSNNATIFSVPMVPKEKTYSMKSSYRLYKKMKKHIPQMYLSPLAHGFCLLIRRDVIKKHGLFDEIYGKGYGEENDFCMRIRKHGYICAVANRAFVFHFRARSFTPERRSKLVKKNEKIFLARYPEFTRLINEYVSSINEPYS